MVIKIDRKPSTLKRALREKIGRLNNLAPADKAAKRHIMRSLRYLNFKERHWASHLSVENGRIELGSREPGYFNLLSLDGEKLGEIYAAWIVTGSTRG